MKRTPLLRKTPLKRKPMRLGKGRTKYSRRERDFDRMLWTKAQGCAARDWGYGRVASWRGPQVGPCSGPIEAHHAGTRAAFRKADDDTVIPLCSGHHRSRTDLRRCFMGWPPGALREWENAMIEHYQARYAAHVAGMQEACA